MEQERKITINYPFFGLFFLFLVSSSFLNLYLADLSYPEVKLFFFFDSFLQSFIETSLIIVLTHLLEKQLSKKSFLFYLILLFFFFLIRIIDFLFIRMIDLSFLEGWDMILDENISSFIELLKATNISLFLLFLLALVLLSLPFLGVLLFRASNLLAKKRPLSISHSFFFLLIFLSPLALLLWDFSHSSTIHPDFTLPLQKALPWKTTLLQPSAWTFSPEGNLKNRLTKSFSFPPEPKEKGNIYFFIIESLREDFITEQNAPHLFRFKNEGISFDLALSSANGTPLSWFSILHGKMPFFWTEKEPQGSFFLQMLKNRGYQTYLYSASGLDYYNMKEHLFGKNTFLIDFPHFFPHPPPQPMYESDQKALATLLSDMENLKQKKMNCFITFFDSTHFYYSWPKEESIFQPVEGALQCFSPYPSLEKIRQIKNRYRNALHYVDQLFGQFIQFLQNNGLYDDAIIIVTADHGEEFFEHGHLFHASHLSKEQTHVPLYFKLGSLKKQDISEQNLKLISHIDILPTLYEYVFQQKPPKDLFDGDSIFDPNKIPFALTARFNFSQPPYEFFLHNGKKKLQLRFKNPKAIYESSQLEFLFLKDQQEQISFSSPLQIKKEILEKFHPAFQKIFAP